MPEWRGMEQHAREFPDRAIASVQRECDDTTSGRSYIVTDRQYLSEVLRLARIGRAAETDASGSKP